MYVHVLDERGMFTPTKAEVIAQRSKQNAS